MLPVFKERKKHIIIHKLCLIQYVVFLSKIYYSVMLNPRSIDSSGYSRGQKTTLVNIAKLSLPIMFSKELLCVSELW